jgi:hypothetical protein
VMKWEFESKRSSVAVPAPAGVYVCAVGLVALITGFEIVGVVSVLLIRILTVAEKYVSRFVTVIFLVVEVVTSTIGKISVPIGGVYPINDEIFASAILVFYNFSPSW